MRFYGLLLAFLLFAAPAVADDDVAKHVFLGKTEVELPQILGFKEILGQNDEFDKLAKQFVPPENKLLAVYLSYDDVAAMKENAAAGFKKYILVQTTNNDVTISSPADFAVIKDEIVSETGGSLKSNVEAQQQLDSASKFIHDNYHQTSKLQIGETKSLGAFMDSDNIIGVSILANMGVQSQDGAQDLPIAASLSALELKDKVLFVSVYSNYGGADDADFVRQTAKEYARLAYAANGSAAPSEVTPAKPDDSALEDSILNFTLGAVGIAMFAVVTLWLGPLLLKTLRRKKDETV